MRRHGRILLKLDLSQIRRINRSVKLNGIRRINRSLTLNGIQRIYARWVVIHISSDTEQVSVYLHHLPNQVLSINILISIKININI